MKNGEDASTSKIDEEDLPPLQGVQDTKHFKDLELPILARDAKDWSKTAGITPVKILPEREALAKNKQRKAVAQEFLEAAKAVPDKGLLHILQSVNGRVRKRFHKDTETLEYWVEFEDTRATMKDSERTAVKTMARFVPSQQ